MKRCIKFVMSVALLLSVSLPALAAGGIYLGATRVVFDGGKGAAVVAANNSSDSDTWLLRSWVSPYTGKQVDDKDNVKTPFVVTPPLYRLGPKSTVQLRFNRVAGVLPEDRESVYYLNAMAIPPQPSGSGSMMQFALNTRIKFFYRPAALSQTDGVTAAMGQLAAKSGERGVVLSNPTPFYLTLSHVEINGQSVSLEEPMVAPFSQLVTDSKATSGTLSYRVINDFGGLSGIFKKSF